MVRFNFSATAAPIIQLVVSFELLIQAPMICHQGLMIWTPVVNVVGSCGEYGDCM